MKSAKPGAIIYYKHLEILEEAGLSDEQIGSVLRAAIKYDETGVYPKFASPLSAFFTMIKYDLDANRKKYEEIKQERTRVGKLGGRPKKPKKPIGFDETKKTNRFSDSLVVTEVKNTGFFIDHSMAQIINNCGLDSEWMQGPNSFFDFAKERVLENKKYSDLPYGDQKALFISAVKDWEELRDEYPEWKAMKDKQAAVSAKQEALDAARAMHPTKCVKCHDELMLWDGAYHCKECSLICELNKETLEWEWKKW